MKTYQTFVFESCEYDENSGEIRLRYSLDDDCVFVETVELPKPSISTDRRRKDSLNRALFALHLAGGTSYYKTCCPRQIDVRSGVLNDEQAVFWHDTYENGLGEFFCKNDIDFRDLIRFPSVGDVRPASLKRTRSENAAPRVLVPIGGGKDSMVTIELLRKQNADITLFRVGEHPAIDELAKAAGLPLITVRRKLSPALFDLNARGALNGHVPVTAYISCLGVFAAMLYDFDAVVFSNERSADEGNTEFHGMTVNHQWSKSLDFEEEFGSYLKKFVDADAQCFSLLRPLSELHITKIFSQYPEYANLCTSCNANWRLVKERPAEKWCGVCPKCAFVFAMLSAFIEEPMLTEIFNGNLYENETLLPLFRQLLGTEGFKPFECVGTPEETQAAFVLAHRRGNYEETPAMRCFVAEVLPKIVNPEALITEALTPSQEHRIPERFLPSFPC